MIEHVEPKYYYLIKIEQKYNNALQIQAHLF
jgi:hypothetical protein